MHCKICKSKTNLIFHHTQYLPTEKTIVVCRKCHGKIHFSNLKKLEKYNPPKGHCQLFGTFRFLQFDLEKEGFALIVKNRIDC